MFKNISKIGIVFLVICVIGLLFWYVYDYVANISNINPSGDIPNNQVEIISKLNTDFIDDTHILEGTIQIDTDNYFLISRAKSNNVDGKGYLKYDYTIYKYNINNGVYLKNVHFDKHFEYIGISKNANSLWIALIDVESINREESEIWEIDYNNMIVKNKYANTRGAYNFKIVEDSSKWVYTTEKGMYISDKEFKNEKLLIENIPDKKDILNSKGFIPYEIIDNKIIYAKVGYEWIEGLGAIDINNTTNKYVPLMDTSYLKYNDNNLYYTDAYRPKNVVKLNMNTFEEEVILTLQDQSDSKHVERDVKISNDLKYMFVVEAENSDSDTQITLKLYNFDTKDLISTHTLPREEFGYIQDVGFSDNKIVYINYYKLFAWNFLQSKGE